MNVANLENCQKLFELSGWNPNDKVWCYNGNLPGYELSSAVLSTGADKCAAYDLGYLLRNLPNRQVKLRNFGDGFGGTARWSIQNRRTNSGGEDFQAEAESPEDAACLLAITLFEQGVLQR